MNKNIRQNQVSDMRSALMKLKGKRIQIVTTNGKNIRGTVKYVGKDYVVINGYRINNKGVRTSLIFPFFFPFGSFLFFSPFFFI